MHYIDNCHPDAIIRMNLLTQEELDKILVHHKNRHLTICGRIIPSYLKFPDNLYNVAFVGCCFEPGYKFDSMQFHICTFSGCELDQAHFTDCTVYDCSFIYTLIGCGVFNNCDIIGSRFEFCNLGHSEFNTTKLSNTYFYCSDMSQSSMYNCSVTDVDSDSCTYVGSEIDGTDINVPSHVPDTGSFVGLKKARTYTGFSELDKYYIVKLIIPENAKRSNAGRDKCRANIAYVDDIQDMEGNSVDIVVYSMWDDKFAYKRGETVEVKYFYDDRLMECASGIHFFLNRNDAVNYQM